MCTGPVPLRRSHVAIACAVIAALFGTFLQLATPIYETNDDVWFMVVASGAWGSDPSEYLVWTHVVLGRLLRWLYGSAPGIPWYPLYLYAVQYVSSAVLLIILVRVGGSRKGAAAFAVLFGMFQLTVMYRLQFTTTACVATQSGLLALFLATRPHEPHPRRWIALGGALLLLGGLVRQPALYLTLVLVTPLVCLDAWQSGRLRLILLLGCVLGAHVAAWRLHTAHYVQNAPWAEFLDYAAARTPLVNQPFDYRSPETEAALASLGWSRNDLRMLLSHNWSDADVFSAADLRRLRAAIPARRSIAQAAALLGAALGPLWLFLYFSFCHVTLAVVRARWDRRWLLFGAVGSALAVTLYLGVAAKPATRVFLPIMFLVNALALLFTIERRKEDARPVRVPWLPRPTGHRISLAAGLGAYAFLLLAQGRALRRMEQQHRLTTGVFQNLVDALPAKDSTVFVSWGAAFPLQWTSPLREANLNRVRMLLTSGPSRNPLSRAMAAEVGIESITHALYQHPKVRLIGREAYGDVLTQFVRKHHGREIVVTPTWQFPVPPGVYDAALYPQITVYQATLRQSAQE